MGVRTATDPRTVLIITRCGGMYRKQGPSAGAGGGVDGRQHSTLATFSRRFLDIDNRDIQVGQVGRGGA